jgi:hypothetical protein
MMPYTRFSNEWDGPTEGIDTVSIWIHPYLINRPDDFHEKGNIHEVINCRWKDEKINKTGQFIRRSYFIDIQTEALNPNADIFGQILYYLTMLVFEGTLKHLRNADMFTTVNFFQNNFSSFFAINNVDFYFDFKAEDCVLMGEPNPYQDTRYSSDYPSSLKVYSKVKRHEHKNHISHKVIKQMEHQNRIEFHLANGNCDFLHYKNLQGTYETVFLRYLPQFARKWFDHSRNVAKVPYLYKLPYAHHLRQVEDMALAGHIPQYRELLRTPPRPKPGKHYGKNEVDLDWMPQFMTR